MFSLSLANNAEITASHGVLVGACADASTFLCVEPDLTRWEHGPHHLRTKFEPEQLERVAT